MHIDYEQIKNHVNAIFVYWQDALLEFVLEQLETRYSTSSHHSPSFMFSVLAGCLSGTCSGTR